MYFQQRQDMENPFDKPIYIANLMNNPKTNLYFILLFIPCDFTKQTWDTFVWPTNLEKHFTRAPQ